MSKPGRTVRAVTIASALAIVISGCGSGGDTTKVSEPVVDIRSLDVGGYPTKPQVFGTVENMDEARVVEATRLAEHVPLAMEIDPRFTYKDSGSETLYINPDALSGIMYTEKFAEAAPDFISGFISQGQTTPNNQGLHLINAVLIFPDEHKASQAAKALERVDFEYTAHNERVHIPKYTDAAAHWLPDTQSIGSWFATGNLVIFTWIYDYLKSWLEKVDLNALTSLVEKSLDTIVPAVKQFVPTPQHKLMELPADSEGILGRTLPREEPSPLPDPPAVYTGRSALHLSEKPAEDRETFEELGVDIYAERGSKLYRARDKDAAASLVEEVLAGKQYRKSTPPEALPTAKCKEYAGSNSFVPRYYCAIPYERYVAYVWSMQETDVHQKISAQYALLTEAK